MPEIFPEPRTRMTHKAKSENKVEAPDAAEVPETEEGKAPATMEIAFNLSGIRCKELVVAVGGLTGAAFSCLAIQKKLCFNPFRACFSPVVRKLSLTENEQEATIMANYSIESQPISGLALSQNIPSIYTPMFTGMVS